MWIPPSRPPELADSEYGWRMSQPVLVFCRGGQRLVAKLEQADEDCPPRWYSDCSEHWDLGDRVLAWQPLPPVPDEAELARLLAQ